MTKISIVTPCFNHEEYIERTMDSVLSQEGDFEIEYLVMDGGSRDRSAEIIRSYAERIENGSYPIRCKKVTMQRVSEKDKGQSDAINKGLMRSTGTIVTYLNSDDTYEPGALQAVSHAFTTSQKQRCFGKCRIIDKHDKEIRKPITRYKNFFLRRYSYSRLLSENFISQMTVFRTRTAMEKVGYFEVNEHYCMDYDYWLKLGAHYQPVYVDRYLANFRFYQTSKSGSYFMKQFPDELRLAKQYAKGKYRGAILLHTFNVRKICSAYKVLYWLKR